MNEAPLYITVSVNIDQFMLSLSEVTASLQRLGDAASRTGIAFRKFIYWMDYGRFFNHPNPSADLLALIEERWHR